MTPPRFTVAATDPAKDELMTFWLIYDVSEPDRLVTILEYRKVSGPP
jgi:hypothetical protein